MIAVDATVLTDFIVGEPDVKRRAVQSMRDDPDWISVSLSRYELGNVLWKYVRFEGVDSRVMRQNLSLSERLLAEVEEALDVVAMWDVVCAAELSFYHAVYVWLARSRGLKLRTRDKPILRECPDVAMPIPEV